MAAGYQAAATVTHPILLRDGLFSAVKTSTVVIFFYGNLEQIHTLVMFQWDDMSALCCVLPFCTVSSSLRGLDLARTEITETRR